MDEDVKYYGVFDASGKAQAFFASDVFPPNETARNVKIPPEAVEITKEQWQTLLEYQGTARYVDGEITYIDSPPPPPPEMSPIAALSKRLDEAMDEIAKLKRK